MEITKQTAMGQMLDYDMGIAAVLMQAGMYCVGWMRIMYCSPYMTICLRKKQ